MSGLGLLSHFLGKSCQLEFAVKKALRSSSPSFQQLPQSSQRKLFFLRSPFLYVNSKTALFSPFLCLPTALELDRRKPDSADPFPRWREEKLLQLLREQKWLLMDGSELEAKRVHKHVMLKLNSSELESWRMK